MSRCLITGGAGFLGSHLCDKLIENKHIVICIDSLITGCIANIEHLESNKNFHFIKQDVSSDDGRYVMGIAIKKAGGIDYILHFASPASPKDYQKYPIQTLRAGAFGTYNLLEIAREEKAIFLLASTSEVYGSPLINPQPEEYWGNVNSVGPRSMYDEAKRFAEALTVAYYNKYKVDTRIARIFNTYGPRMKVNDGRVIPNFIDQALNNKPLTIYGDGSQTRSFCHVSDMVDGLYKLLISDITELINLGNPDEISILDLAKEIIEITDSKSDIVFKPLPIDDPKVRKPNITKAKKLLNWEPLISRREGISRML